MIYLKTDDEVELLREANLLVGKTLAELAKIIKPGVTTRQLDVLAETFIRDHGQNRLLRTFPTLMATLFLPVFVLLLMNKLYMEFLTTYHYKMVILCRLIVVPS